MIAERLMVFVVFAAVFAVHARWIFLHFSSDGYLVDSGWFAYLFGAADPLLRNPSGVNGLSYYAHHMSPFIFLFGAPLSVLGLNGIAIFALHQGLFFGLFLLSSYLLIAPSPFSGRNRIAAVLGAMVIGALSNILFQAAAYPHFEIALLALSSLAIAGWLGGHRGLFGICLLVLPLIREDGGLYAAFVCLACIAITNAPRQSAAPSETRLLVSLALVGIAATVVSLYLKARLFPGFDAFETNFAGDSWSHLSGSFLAGRLGSLARNLSLSPILVGSAILAIYDIKYLSGVALLLPLILLHLVAVRDEIGHFTLYYALPWLLSCTIWLAVLARRASSSHVAIAEPIVVLVASLWMSAPLQAAIGADGRSWRVARAALTERVAGLESMTEFVLWTRREYVDAVGRSCVSLGIAALVPNDVAPDDVLQAPDDIARCGSVLLMRGDMQYDSLRSRAEAETFVLSAVRENAELWTRGFDPVRENRLSR